MSLMPLIQTRPPPLSWRTTHAAIVSEAAAYLGLKISYLHKLMMRHAIPYYKPMGKLCFFSQADLDHWLTCNRIASQKEIEQQAQQYLSTKRMEKK